MAALDDQDVRERAGSDLRQSFIVDAGAGTGKTTVLISRILGAVASGKSSLERIVAITFTEKAAGELKARLRTELEKALREFTSEKWSYVRDALAEIERAQVSTIHSFCATLLRERPIEAGVNPDFDVLDEIGANLLLDQSWEDWLAREMDRPAGGLEEVLETGIDIEDIQPLGKFLIHHRDALEAPAPVAENREAFLLELANTIPLLEELQKRCLDPTDRGWIQIEALKERHQDLQGGVPLRRLISQPLTLRPNDGNQKNWFPKESLGEVKRLVADLRARCDDLLAAMRHNLAVGLLHWLQGYVRHYEAAKKEKGCLDFFDLLYRTRELLKNNREVRDYFQGRFDYILVDEFQDTDPLQVEIFFFLAESSPRANSWTEVRVKPGKLFLVGDPKQSIYRFRRADIETYDAAQKILVGQGEVLDLSLNFRSRPHVVEWVNNLFSDLIRPSEEGFYQPPYRPIVASLPGAGQASVRFLPLSPRVPVGNGAAGDLRAAEARTVAALLKRVVAEGWEIWDQRNRKRRKIGYGDVGILFRAKEAMDLYEEEFRDFEIPYRVAGGRRYYSRQEMGALLAVLSAIDNPKDKAALTAALRSPFFSASDEELFLFVSGGHALDYLEVEGNADAPAASIQTAFRLMRELHHLRNEMSVPLFILHLYEKSRILPFLYLRPQGDQKVSNLFKVVDMARALARQGLVTLRSFVQFLSKMESAEAEEGESPLAEESEDVVRLMTIHKAKGLEFPMVILGDAAYQSRKRAAEGIINRQEGHVEIRLGNRAVQIATRGWEAAGEKERLREAAEDSRLLYVAATRARDYLVIPLIPGDKKRFLGPLSGNLDAAGDLPPGKLLYPFGRGGPPVQIYDSRRLDVEKRELRPFRISVEAKKKKRDGRSLDRFHGWRQGLEKIHRSGTKGRQIIAASALAREGEGPPAGRRWIGGAGAHFGSLVHELLSRVEWPHPQGLEIMAPALGRKYGLKDEEAKRGAEAVRWGLSSDIMKRAARSERVWRELPFVYNHRGALIEGFVDLAFEEDGEIIVVDFKTDRVEGAELEERARHYAPQGIVYAMALEGITGKKVKEVVFLFVSARLEKSIPLGKSARQRVERLLKGRASARNESERAPGRA